MVIKDVFKAHNIKAKKVIPVIPRYSVLVNDIKIPPVHKSRIDQFIEFETKQQNLFVNEEVSTAYHCLKDRKSL
jgi:Tfp pilus assembly PilM family ATPase